MKTNEIRNSKKVRLWTIGGLIVLAAILLFFVKSTWAKIVLGSMIALLAVAFGLEAKNTDYDVATLAKTGSFQAAKIQRDEKGNLINVDAFCNAEKADYNCDDFVTQSEAQAVYDRCKTLGKNMDVYGLDGNNNNLVCEANRKTAPAN